MSKLNATIDQIELNTNKVTGTAPSSGWTDTQYPSAKALYNAYSSLLNIQHPIGSIIITSTKTNPANTLGGTWVLVDKAFKNTYINLNSTHWTKANANLYGYSSIMLNDHTISLRLGLETTKAITAADVNNVSLTLGTVDITAFGISSLSHTIYNAVAFSDNGQSTICYRIATNGQIDLFDVLHADGTHTMPTASSFYIYLVQPINYDVIQDDFCDKFYWKRTA